MPEGDTMSAPAVAKRQAPSAPGIGNREFLCSLGIALVSLFLSSVLLVGGYAMFSPRLAELKADTIREDARPWTFRGADLIPRIGSAKPTDSKGLEVTALDDNQAIITRRVSLRASDYPFAQYTVTGSHPGTDIYLMWRTEENEQEVSRARLNWNGDIVTSHHLAKHEAWRGRIIEIGLDIYGDLREQPLVISSLSLSPGTWRQLLSTIWSEWTVYRGWTQKSVNYQRGTPKNPILSPTLAMATWCGLALLLLGISYLFTRRHSIVAYTSVIFIPWIALDLLWQTELSTQLQETKHLFAGKTQHEKHLADFDSELYSYARYLKHDVLPEPGARVFLLHDSRQMTYTRLKAQYYLLPHNTYNYDRFPRKKMIRKGDYILVLGQVEGLVYDPEKRVLRWHKKALRVKHLDSHHQGQLYRVIRGKK